MIRGRLEAQESGGREADLPPDARRAKEDSRPGRRGGGSRPQAAKCALAVLLLAGFAWLRWGPVFALPLAICPVKRFLALDCPGCGLTRGLASLVRGDLQAALAYHPLSPLALALLAAALIALLWDVFRGTRVAERILERAAVPIGIPLAALLLMVRALR